MWQCMAIICQWRKYVCMYVCNNGNNNSGNGNVWQWRGVMAMAYVCSMARGNIVYVAIMYVCM
jgi:hypothetical protein